MKSAIIAGSLPIPIIGTIMESRARDGIVCKIEAIVISTTESFLLLVTAIPAGTATTIPSAMARDDIKRCSPIFTISCEEFSLKKSIISHLHSIGCRLVISQETAINYVHYRRPCNNSYKVQILINYRHISIAEVVDVKYCVFKRCLPV